MDPGDFLASHCCGDCRGQPCWGHWWGMSPLQTPSSAHNMQKTFLCWIETIEYLWFTSSFLVITALQDSTAPWSLKYYIAYYRSGLRDSLLMPQTRWSSDDSTNFVEMTVQPIVNDRVKVLQAAPVERIEDVSACPRLLKPGIHVITVLQLKQEVRHRRRNPFIFRQVTKICVLVEIKEKHCKQKSK